MIHAPFNIQFYPSLLGIEVTSFRQLPSFSIIGLASQEISESRDRVRSAIESSGFEFPQMKIIVNLTPASIKKKGTGLDLGIALALLLHQDPNGASLHGAAWGELSLTGEIKSVGQTTRAILAAWDGGTDFLVLPASDRERSLRSIDLLKKSGRKSKHAFPELIWASTLREAWTLLGEGKPESEEKPKPRTIAIPEFNWSERLMPISSETARWIGIAASGNHHLLLLGPKGVGKSHLMEWAEALYPSAQPEMALEQALSEELENSHLKSISSSSFQTSPELRTARKVASQVRPATLVGGMKSGAWIPGEFSLAHGRLLIADEFLEWHRDSREALREPLETGETTLSRSEGRMTFPAKFTLAATANLCPCGGMHSHLPLVNSQRCRCLPKAKKDYLNRLSGPLFERIDLVLLLRSDLCEERKITFHELRRQTLRATAFAQSHYGKPAGNLSSTELESLTSVQHISSKVSKILTQWSLRSRHQIFRVALTIASWDERPLEERDILEAIQWRDSAERLLHSEGNEGKGRHSPSFSFPERFRKTERECKPPPSSLKTSTSS